MDWRCSRDQQTASAQAENRPRGCPTFAEVTTGKSLSSNLGTESGESGPTTTALAPASPSADADTGHESAASGGDERGLSLEEKTVQRTGTNSVGEALVGSLGQPAPKGIIGAAGPTGSKDCGVNYRS